MPPLVLRPLPEAFDYPSASLAPVTADTSTSISLSIPSSFQYPSSISAAISTCCEGRNAADFQNEIFSNIDLFSIDAVEGNSDDDDSDDGNNGDFEEFVDEPFVEVTRGRSASRSPATSRTSTSRSSISSVTLVPPTPTSNAFSPLLESEDVPSTVPSAPVSWDFRQPLERESSRPSARRSR